MFDVKFNQNLSKYRKGIPVCKVSPYVTEGNSKTTARGLHVTALWALAYKGKGKLSFTVTVYVQVQVFKVILIVKISQYANCKVLNGKIVISYNTNWSSLHW